MDTLLYWHFHALLETEEDAIRVGEICDQLKCHDIGMFTRMYVVLLFHFPLKGGLKKAFDNADTLDQQIGIATRHLIRVAKWMDISQVVIDRFVQVKNTRDFWVDHGSEIMKDKHDEVEDLKLNPVPDATEKLYYAGIEHMRAKTVKDQQRHFLNRITHDLIKAVVYKKKNIDRVGNILNL